jgi:hypothetical protein
MKKIKNIKKKIYIYKKIGNMGSKIVVMLLIVDLFSINVLPVNSTMFALKVFTVMIIDVNLSINN